MKKLILLLSVCVLAVAVRAAESSASPAFQMRVVSDQPAADTEVLTHQYYSEEAKQPFQGKLNLKKSPLIDASAVKKADAEAGQDGKTRIRLNFTPVGEKHFTEATRQNVGNRVAVVMGGKVYSVRKIEAEITSGHIWLTGMTNLAEAKQLAAAINVAAAGEGKGKSAK